MAVYETVIGLEVHVQLSTRSKIFCACSTEFGRAPNSNTCPICLGLPGVLPVLNHQGVELSIKSALALNCRIAPFSRFARKNYFYPDLPKGYQISQYELPLAQDGYIDLNLKNGAQDNSPLLCKRIRINRLHLEEDAGKLIHGENLANPQSSYVNLNRAGIPLIEIVSEPDLNSPEEAREYLLRLKAILEYLRVSNCDMEKGSLRCDANISLRPAGEDFLGIKTELKNMNSFRNVQKALEYEIKRQQTLLEEGKSIIQETRLWDTAKGITVSMRGKEEAHDYRYFPEPDLIPLQVKEEWIKEIKLTLPELPEARKARLIKEYGLPAYDAGVLTSCRSLADYYEECVKLFPRTKIVSNWVMGELLRELKNSPLHRQGNLDQEIKECPISPEQLVSLLKLIQGGTISSSIGKTVFSEMFKTGKPAREIVQEKGLIQLQDKDTLVKLITQVLKEHPQETAAYKKGKEKLWGFFVGQVMKLSRGKANPQLVNKLLKEKLQTTD